MVPYGSDIVILKIELNQQWPVGAPAGIEDEIEYWAAPGGLWVPPEWRLLSRGIVGIWVRALKNAEGLLVLAGHAYRVHGTTALPVGQDPSLIYYEGGFGDSMDSSGAA